MPALASHAFPSPLERSRGKAPSMENGTVCSNSSKRAIAHMEELESVFGILGVATEVEIREQEAGYHAVYSSCSRSGAVCLAEAPAMRDWSEDRVADPGDIVEYPHRGRLLRSVVLDGYVDGARVAGRGENPYWVPKNGIRIVKKAKRKDRRRRSSRRNRR